MTMSLCFVWGGADRVDGVISDGFTELAHVLDLRPPVSRPGEERIATAVC